MADALEHRELESPEAKNKGGGGCESDQDDI
jgi:hypothetical protein